LDAFLDSADDGSYYVGHATVLVRLAGKLVLIDPVLPRPLFLDSWLFFPELALDQRLTRVDAVLISHFHEDHYDLRFLRLLAAGTPIWVTYGRTGFEQLLGAPEFNTHLLPPLTLTEIMPGVEVLPLPSDHNAFDSSFIVRSREFALYQGNDNFLPDETICDARKLAGPVDEAYIPYAYVWWYPLCVTSISEERRTAEARRLNERSMAIGRNLAITLEAKLVVPSAGNLVFYDSADSVVNRGIASPFDYLDYTRAVGGDREAEHVRIMLAGDFALHRAGAIRVVQEPRTKTSFFAEMAAFLQAWNVTQPRIPERSALSERDAHALRERVARAPQPSFPTQVWFMRADGPDAALTLDLRTGQIGSRLGTQLQPETMIFRIEARAFEAWVRGEISLETILNSQRFTLDRDPEVFDPALWSYLRQYL
jgi:hypothetical protein